MQKWAMLFHFRGDEVTCEYVRIRESLGDSSGMQGTSQVWLVTGTTTEVHVDPWMEPVFLPAKPSQSIN